MFHKLLKRRCQELQTARARPKIKREAREFLEVLPCDHRFVRNNLDITMSHNYSVQEIIHFILHSVRLLYIVGKLFFFFFLLLHLLLLGKQMDGLDFFSQIIETSGHDLIL